MKLKIPLRTFVILTMLFFTSSISMAQILQGDSKALLADFYQQLLLGKLTPQVLEYEIRTSGKDTSVKICNVIVKKKSKKYLIEFTTPADMKGTRLLNLDTGQNYVYLPAFGRVRRIASSGTNQNFFGMAMSLGDLTLITYLAEYYDTATKVISADAEMVELEFRAGPAVNAPYPKINIGVGKHGKLQYVACFDGSGKKIKTMRYNNYTCEQDLCLAGEWVVTDLVNNYETKMISKSRKVNVQISDETFSKANLDK